MKKKNTHLKILIRLIVYFSLGVYFIADMHWGGPISYFVQKKREQIGFSEFDERKLNAVARIYAQFITQEELNSAFRSYLFQSGKKASDFSATELKQKKLYVLNTLVNDAVLRYVTTLNATRRTLNQEDIDREWSAFIARFPSKEEFTAALAAQKISERDMKWLLESRLVQEVQIKANIETGATPTEEELQKTYQELLAAHPPVITRRCSHIFLSTLHKNRDEVETQAQDLLNKLSQGDSFDDLAGQYSNDPSTKGKGGDLGEVSSSRPLPGELEKKIFTLPDNTPTLVHSPMGIHIIKAGEKTTHSLPDFNTLRPELESAIISLRQGTLVDLYLKTIREKPTRAGWIATYPDKI